MTASEIAANVMRVRERMERAALHAGRSAGEITLIAVSKTMLPEHLIAAYAAGVRNFGENYVQEALAKVAQPALELPDIVWHFIGHLQSNKAREVVGRFALIHSVDSVALAGELARRSRPSGRAVPILLEIKLDPATTKFGIDPAGLPETVEALMQLEGVRLCGLMGMAPYGEAPEQARPYFRRLYALYEQLPQEARQALSMGMTGDFEVAIEEGATHVRIGTAIFGRRQVIGRRH
jgi:pyridoxal phosphate enzyme (YggS family)